MYLTCFTSNTQIGWLAPDSVPLVVNEPSHDAAGEKSTTDSQDLHGIVYRDKCSGSENSNAPCEPEIIGENLVLIGARAFAILLSPLYQDSCPSHQLELGREHSI